LPGRHSKASCKYTLRRLRKFVRKAERPPGTRKPWTGPKAADLGLRYRGSNARDQRGPQRLPIGARTRTMRWNVSHAQRACGEEEAGELPSGLAARALARLKSSHRRMRKKSRYYDGCALEFSTETKRLLRRAKASGEWGATCDGVRFCHPRKLGFMSGFERRG